MQWTGFPSPQQVALLWIYHEPLQSGATMNPRDGFPPSVDFDSGGNNMLSYAIQQCHLAGQPECPAVWGMAHLIHWG